MKVLLIIAAALLLLTGLPNAGTVTFTGSCTKAALNSTVISFKLLNSGNDTAYNLFIVPNVRDASPENSSYGINTMTPGSQKTLNITLVNVTARGTYASYFITTYQQGSSVFTAVFPCHLDFYSATVSHVYLTSSVSQQSNRTTFCNSVWCATRFR